MRTIPVQGITTERLQVSTMTGHPGISWYFKLVAAGVTVEGDEVTFHSQAEMENFYETW